MRERQKAEKRGRRAETAACVFLFLKGYRILERRCRTRYGELDIVAEKAGRIVFVEVKHRKNNSWALEAVTHKQRKRIERAALSWMQNHRKLKQSLRFDVITIAWPRLPTHIKDAWQADLQAML
ncbi:YraN family protein [Kordiimonas sp.]|uniref:YraN family protein n=1 Tax=Kordiimonas sp. TaxID=1970157 RepID=UPI003A914BEE